MKNVFFIRHAKSSWANPELRDIERPLNKRGLRDAPFMAKLLNGKGIKPDAIISSPANRAFTTASFFAAELGIKKEDIIVNSKIYHADPEDILDEIKILDDDLQTVLVFGHNPTWTELANHFSAQYLTNVPTCGIAQVESKAEKWEDFENETAGLKAFYYPKQYFK